MSGPDDDETRLGPDDPAETRLERPATRPSSASGSSNPSTSSSGWLSAADAIDHGRFPPGTLLGGRYRIVGRLGRGGMGEVYRADDLKLGQVVALKFLPAEVDRDPARLTQLHTEVRMARQVSHPNVCRVYDIDEVDGQTFLSMEYVDGEDLASLLRRVGRFPQDRALEIARQLCAGLAVAHDRAVIHRDLKPANVMLDAAGNVRITDFGLAGAAGQALRAGTPAYMSPEQLAGREVGASSDIYALGLVLYELFTGHRAVEAHNVAELIRKREQAGILPPSALVRNLDPDIDTAIMRCLRPDPDKRPASAIAVSAALPGGDPLAAALAAGETPSPEMVADAGASEAVASRWIALVMVWIAVALVAVAVMYQRVMLINRVPTPKPPAVLVDRAGEILGKLGYPTSGQYSASGLAMSLDYPRYIATTKTGADRWKALAEGRPETLVLWHRTSPRPLVPWTFGPVTGLNPPLNVSGMTLVGIDASGRLAELVAIPEPFDSGGAHAAADWRVLFDAAALPMPAFTPVPPTFNPVMYVDERRAWEARLDEAAGQVLRVEAAAYKGKPVSFQIVGPWSRSFRGTPSAPSIFDRLVGGISSLVMPALILSAVLLARNNIRRGRGDRRGAMRAAAIVFVSALIAWLLGTTHFADLDLEINRLFASTGSALFQAGLMWLTYLGLEPYVRRFAPDSLIGWTRLISGRWRDPEVGRDILIGLSTGLAMTILYAVHNLIPVLAGRPEPMPLAFDPSTLMGPRFVLSNIVATFGRAVISSMLAVVGIVALLIFLERAWLAWLAGVSLFVWVVIQGMFSPGTPLLDLAIGAGIIGVYIAAMMRWGLLATIVALFTHFMLLRGPLTIDAGSWRFNAGLTYVLVLAGLGLLGGWLARHSAVRG